MLLCRMEVYGSAFLLILFAAASNATVVKFDISSLEFVGNQYLNCSPDYSLLSCGIGNSQMKIKNNEYYRFAVPDSPTRCRCSDAGGANCFALCASSVKKFQIITTEVKKGVFTATCPIGKLVVGCATVPSNQGMEQYRYFYPSTHGDYCTCYDYYGATCVASCVSNVVNYRVEKAYGTGNFEVYCTNGRSVLGCGMWPSPVDDKPEEWRATTFVPNVGCSCYDDHGTWCYAICGNLS